MDDIKSIFKITICYYVFMAACAESDIGDSDDNGENPSPQYSDPESLSDEELLKVEGAPVDSENLAYHYIDAICHTAQKCCRDRGMPIPDGM